MELEKAKVHGFLRSLNGKFFTVEFIKRSTGEVRVMRATTNYESKLAGGDLGYDANGGQVRQEARTSPRASLDSP